MWSGTRRMQAYEDLFALATKLYDAADATNSPDVRSLEEL